MPKLIDWLNLKQTHYLAGGKTLPQFSSGEVASFSFDEDGELQLDWTSKKYFCHEGSFDTRVMVRVVGNTVEFRGNIGAFCRQDNVFGYDFDDCLSKLNQLLDEQLGLPPFTKGESFLRSIKKGKSCERVWTGASVSRIDVTHNYETGSPQFAEEYLHYLSRTKTTRLRLSAHGNNDTIHTVAHGEKSKYRSVIIYNKAQEFKKHKDLSDPYNKRLYEYLEERGVIRLELRLKQRYLAQNGLRYLGDITMEQLELIFDEVAGSIIRNADISRVNDLGKPARSTYVLWKQDGYIPQSTSTYYRHRREILDVLGIDIGMPPSRDDTGNVIQFPNVRVIEVAAAQPPDFYQLPAIADEFYLKTA